jgi:transposase
MDHVAIDLGGRESQVCARAPDGAIVEERRLRTRDLPAFLASRPPSRVILETCAEAFRMADAARESGHDVRVVSATIVRALGVGARRVKTDRRDAQVLSEVSTRIDLKGVHIPSVQSRDRRSVCVARDALVATRTQLINTVRGWLRGSATRPRSGASETFVRRVRAIATEIPPHIEALLEVLSTVSDKIDELTEAIADIAKSDSVCRLLMSVPGVGPVTSVRFVATLDDVQRFSSATKVQAYLGLTPGENSSSDRVRRTGITKAGCASLRWTLVQAAHSMKRFRPSDPMVQWATQIQARRGKSIAVVALARKLAGVLFAMWRDGVLYDPARAARPTSAPALSA